MRLFIFIFHIGLSVGIAADTLCSTITSEPTQDQIDYWDSYSRTVDPTIKAHVHLIKDQNGGGSHAVTTAEAHLALNRMAFYYEDDDIFFSVDSITEIHDNARYGGNNYLWWTDNPHGDAVDIYLYPDNVLNGGESLTIISRHLFVGGTSDNTELVQSAVLAHEMGHCLGLYHTHRGYNGESVDCPETGPADCDSCGDFICDTPPDPTLWDNVFDVYYVDSSCEFCCTADTADFNPDAHNIMSYTKPKCMYSFTDGQITRMCATIEDTNEVDSVVINVGTYSTPSAPTGLSWTNSGGHPLLSWNIHSDTNVAGYEVYRDITGGSFVYIGYAPGRVITRYYDPVVDIVGPKFPPAYAYYKIKAITFDRSVKSNYSNMATVPTSTAAKTVGGENVDNNYGPEEFSLHNNYPNPFNSNTTISFDLPNPGYVRLVIQDIMGMEICTLIDRFEDGGGTYNVTWNGKDHHGMDMSSGVYLYNLSVKEGLTGNQYIHNRKMLLIK